MGTFELGLTGQEPKGLPKAVEKGLGSAVLVKNAHWFIKVRWIVVGIFAVIGLVGVLFSKSFRPLGITIPVLELWILTPVLIAANVAFYLTARRFNPESPSGAVLTHIWLQIILDLLAITVLVHCVGSTVTFIAFTYLFHVVLACIFFPKRDSLLVTLLAVGLYIISVLLEIANLWPAAGMFAFSRVAPPQRPGVSLLFAASAVFIWLVVWYFAATLSEGVRRSDLQLSVVNRKLIEADHEKTRQMLLTTHDLKAPFAGIESNIEVLKVQYWELMPEDVRTILDRIDLRAQTLRQRINAILLFGDLKSQETSAQVMEAVNLQEMFAAIEEELREKAKDRLLILSVKVPSVPVIGSRRQFQILFSNLVSNAIFYSYEGGTVTVKAEPSPHCLTISVADQGIGIREEALPHIFDEYYRTKEGAKFNRMSTGLGLAIVKEIARHYGLKVKVTSSEGRGTTFEITIPGS